jgi:hypothetical protein
MTVREVRHKWPERDCAVESTHYYWVRFGDIWYMVPKRIGQHEDLLAGMITPKEMMRFLTGFVLRCACCGAEYSPRVVVFDSVGRCRNLLLEVEN